jgi:hypothetical protein
VYDRVHLVFAGPGVFGNTIKPQRFWRAPATLVEGGNKAGLRPDFLELLFEAAHFESLFLMMGEENEGRIVQ